MTHDTDWYRDAFGADYLRIYAHRDDETASAEIVHFLARLDVRPHARVLDVCCGAGRHMAAFRQRGMNVIGVDLSAALLAAARDRHGGRLVRGDMRRLPFPTGFEWVFNLFTSFGYFTDDGENRAALAEMARVLRPGGTLVLDHMNRAWVTRTLVARSVDEVQGGTLMQERRIEGARVIKEITWRRLDGEVRRFHESVRMYSPQEVRELMAQCGLTVESLWGDADGMPLGEDSPRMIVVARKGAP